MNAPVRHGWEARVSLRTTDESPMVERVARALMEVCARMPASPDGLELPVLALDPDFDDLPLHEGQGTADDEITQAAVLKLARAAIVAMREPNRAMIERGWDTDEPTEVVWREMVDAALWS